MEGVGGGGGGCSGAARRGGGECDVWVAGTLVEIKVKISASSPIFIYKVWLTEMIVISLNPLNWMAAQNAKDACGNLTLCSD